MATKNQLIQEVGAIFEANRHTLEGLQIKWEHYIQQDFNLRQLRKVHKWLTEQFTPAIQVYQCIWKSYDPETWRRFLQRGGVLQEVRDLKFAKKSLETEWRLRPYAKINSGSSRQAVRGHTESTPTDSEIQSD